MGNNYSDYLAFPRDIKRSGGKSLAGLDVGISDIRTVQVEESIEELWVIVVEKGHNHILRTQAVCGCFAVESSTLIIRGNRDSSEEGNFLYSERNSILFYLADPS